MIRTCLLTYLSFFIACSSKKSVLQSTDHRQKVIYTEHVNLMGGISFDVQPKINKYGFLLHYSNDSLNWISKRENKKDAVHYKVELLSDKINILTTEYSQRYPRFDTVFFLPAMVVWKMTEYSRSASGTMPSRKLKTSVEVYKMIENDVIHYSIRAGGGKDLEMKRILMGIR